MLNMAASTSRGKNVTKDQKLMMVTLMEENLNLANDRFDGINGKEANKSKWIEISAQLNSIVGARKDGEKWRRAWIDMKKYVRGQWTLLKEYDNRTGLGMEGPSRRPNQLSPLDERILNITTKEACEGTGNLESGIELPSQQVNSSNLTAGPSNTNPMNSPSNVVTSEPETSRPLRTKRIRGSSYTRDKLLEESNKIEKEKVAALNRIAAAMTEKNLILRDILKNNNYRMPVSNASSPEYLETVYLEDD